MPDEKKAEESKPEDVKEKDKSQDVKPESIPYPRFKEVNDRLKQYEEREKNQQDADKKAKEDKLIADKKFQEVIDSQKVELERLTKLEQGFTTQDKAVRESALAKLTDDKMKGIASELSTAKLLDFVDSYSNKIAPPANPKGSLSDQKAEDMKPKLNESPQTYADRMSKLYQARGK